MDRSRLLPLMLAAAFVAWPAAAPADTALHLGERIVIDGFTGEWLADEEMFGINTVLNTREESLGDSKWGPNNDIHQILVTWDKDNLYIAGEGFIYGNNMMLLIDVLPERGIENMSGLTSWSRNFQFTQGFAPDLFSGTWDGNARPRLLIHRGGTQIDDQVSGGIFISAATFSQDLPGRSMELSIPWNTLFLGSEGFGARDSVVNIGGQPDTVRIIPKGAVIRICGVITAGGDNTGGPDSAPDNTQGHVVDGNAQVFIDNYLTLSLDEVDDTGLGGGGPDGVADWGVSPVARRTFRIQPPILGLRFAVDGLKLNRPAFAPDRGDTLRFSISLDKELDAGNPLDQIRQVAMGAQIYDMRGKLVRDLYRTSAFENGTQDRPAVDPSDPAYDKWDGRDEEGRIVPAGIYVLRVTIDPNVSRYTRSFVVVR